MSERRREFFPDECPLKHSLLSRVVGRSCVDGCYGPIELEVLESIDDGWDVTMIVTGERVRLCGAVSTGSQLSNNEIMVIDEVSPVPSIIRYRESF